MVRVDKTNETLERLRQNGGRRAYNTKEDYENMIKINWQLEQARRDYIIKDNNSEISASESIFTA